MGQFRELAGSPKEEWDAEKGFRATRRLTVDWVDRNAFVQAILGTPGLFGGTPASHYPGRPGVLPKSVTITPFLSEEDPPVYQLFYDDPSAYLNNYNGIALIEVTYETTAKEEEEEDPGEKPETEPETYLTRSWDFGGEYMLFPGMKAAANGSQNMTAQEAAAAPPVDPSQKIARFIPITEHRFVWSRVSKVPWDAIRNMRGKVNDAELWGCLSETLLFMGCQVEREYAYYDDTDVDPPKSFYKVTYIFREKQIPYAGATYGWNHIFQAVPAPPAFKRQCDPAGKPMYPTATNDEFEALFKYEA